MSHKTHTHYDNLKVARDADLKTIRASYRALCKQYHPDSNPGNPDAHRIMSIINRSYKVLSTPEKRRKHDEWIAKQNHTAAQAVRPQRISTPMPEHLRKRSEPVSLPLYIGWLLAVLLLIAALFYYTQQQRHKAAQNGTDLPVKIQRQK